jgi:hypothetical protein
MIKTKTQLVISNMKHKYIHAGVTFLVAWKISPLLGT